MAGRFLRYALAGAISAALLIPLASTTAGATQATAADAAQATRVDAVEPASVVQVLQDVWAQRDAATRALDDAQTSLVKAAQEDRARRPRPDRLAELTRLRGVVVAMQSQISLLDSRAGELKGRLANAANETRAAVPVDPQRDQIDAAMARIPYPVLTLGAPVVQGNHPRLGPAWGAYDRDTNVVYIGADAFATPERLQYVVAHEFAHAWENTRLTPEARDRAYAIAAAAGSGDPAELFADCLAKVWGAGAAAFYWDCPDSATTQIARLVAAPGA